MKILNQNTNITGTMFKRCDFPFFHFRNFIHKSNTNVLQNRHIKYTHVWMALSSLTFWLRIGAIDGVEMLFWSGIRHGICGARLRFALIRSKSRYVVFVYWNSFYIPLDMVVFIWRGWRYSTNCLKILMNLQLIQLHLENEWIFHRYCCDCYDYANVLLRVEILVLHCRD